VLFTNYDMVQAEINWITNSTKYNKDQNAIIGIYNSYFGVGMSGLVFQTIRESKALAYNCASIYKSPNKKDKNYINISYVGTQADKFETTVAAMNDLLNNMPLVQDSFERSKIELKKTIETERIDEDGIIFNYLAAQEMGEIKDPRQKVYQALSSLNLKDIELFQHKYIAHQPITYCVVASDKKVSQEQLSKLGTVTNISLEQIFGY
jgi:predicted Zn-dependent peptidase